MIIHAFISKCKLINFILILLPVFVIAQNNSPWKNLSSKTIGGVFLGLGKHEYSLSNGQGFAVYLKNTTKDTLIVSGSVVAKTVCSNEVVTNFNVTLLPYSIASGGNFGSNNLTGVVTKADCIGKLLPNNNNYTNRIEDVIVRNIVVKFAKEENTIALKNTESVKQVNTDNLGNKSVTKAIDNNNPASQAPIKKVENSATIEKTSISQKDTAEKKETRTIAVTPHSTANIVSNTTITNSSNGILKYIGKYNNASSLDEAYKKTQSTLLVIKRKIYAFACNCNLENNKYRNFDFGSEITKSERGTKIKSERDTNKRTTEKTKNTPSINRNFSFGSEIIYDKEEAAIARSNARKEKKTQKRNRSRNAELLERKKAEPEEDILNYTCCVNKDGILNLKVPAKLARAKSKLIYDNGILLSSSQFKISKL